MYDFAELSAKIAEILAQALERMPPELARYKSLTAALPRALELLPLSYSSHSPTARIDNSMPTGHDS